MKTIIFDFDGVIHDTFEFHRQKIKEFTGIEISDSDYRNVHRKNFFFNIPEAFKNINWNDYSEFVHEEQSKLETNSEIKKTIINLGKQNNLFIVSSAGTKNIKAYLENNQLLNYFKEVLGMDVFRLKVDKFKYLIEGNKISIKDSLFITDTLGDIVEANTLKIKTVAVDFGFHDRKTLEEGNPYKIISNFSDLNEII